MLKGSPPSKHRAVKRATKASSAELSGAPGAADAPYTALPIAGIHATSGGPDALEQVSSLRRSEAETRQRLHEIEQIYAHSPIGLFTIDREYRFTRINERMAEINGFSVAQHLGKTLEDVLPELAGILKDAYRPVFERGEPVLDVEIEGNTPKEPGHKRNWLGNYFPLRSETGEVIGLSGAVLEITARKRAEESMRASKEHLRIIIDTNPECIKLVGADGRLLEMNPAGLAMIEADSLDQVSRALLSNLLLPEHRAAFQALSEKVLQGNKGTLEFEIEGLKGTRRWLQTHAVPMTGQNGETVLLGITRDITASKVAEETQTRLSHILESSLDEVYVFDTESLQFEYVNQAALRNLGYPLETMQRMTAVNLKPEFTEAAFREVIAPLIRHEQAQQLFETKHLRADGSLYPVEVHLQLVEHKNKRVFLAVILDITERKQAEAVRAALEGQLRESQKMEAMGILAAGVAHDFNNIIATIMGNTALAKNDVWTRPDDVLLSLEQIDKAAARAKNLVQQILTFGRKDMQTFVVQPVRPLVEESMSLQRSTIPPGVEFVARFTETPLYASVDSSQIVQVLINLCTNACHAMKDRAGRIEIEMAEVLLDQPATQALSADLHPGRYVHLSVSDNGSGMDAATQAHIFEPFFTTKGVGLGTGLSLSVVHGIVKSHQGAITVESAPGKGTTFAVYLPAMAHVVNAADVVDVADVATPAEAERVAVARPADAAHALGASQVGGKRVLYVDDDEALVLLVQRVLKQLGYRASGYMAGHDAVEAIRFDPLGFDLVVSDYNMPGMSGLDVATEVRSIRPDLPVVIFSGHVTNQLRSDALRAGVREVINKADTVAEMCRNIQQLLLVETT